MRFAALFALSLLAASPAFANADAPPAEKHKPDLSGLHDFDFVAGEWRVHHRVLKERLAGSHDWMDFDGTQKAWLTLNGYYAHVFGCGMIDQAFAGNDSSYAFGEAIVAW